MSEKRISLFWAIWWVTLGLLLVVVVFAISSQLMGASKDDQICLANEIRPHAEQEYNKYFSDGNSALNNSKQPKKPLSQSIQDGREINLVTPESQGGTGSKDSTYYLQSPLLDPQFGSPKRPSADLETHWERIYWDGNSEGTIELPDQVEAQLKLIQKQSMRPEELVGNGNGTGTGKAPIWAGPTSWTIESEPATSELMAEIQEWWPQLSLNSMMINQKFPNYRFIFGLEEPEPGSPLEYQWMGLSVWDVNTHVRLTGAPGMTQMKQVVGSNIAITQAVGLWRSTPVKLVLDLAVGPTEARVYNADQIFRQSPDNESEDGLLFVTACPGRIKRISRHREDEVFWELSTNGQDTDRVTLVFMNQSSEGMETWTFEASDRSGRQLPITNSGNSGNLYFKEIRVASSELASLKIGYLKKKYRLIWELEKLPSMPKENEGLKDLFETTIPYLMARNEQDLEVFLESALQLQDLIDKDSKTSPSPRSFPFEFSNVTVRDILHQWVGAKRKLDRIGLDPNNYILEIRPPLLESWLDGLKKVL